NPWSTPFPYTTLFRSKVNEKLALQCWKNNICETGTGGKITVGEADGFGGNVARQLFKMEFILQALTYPQIGKIIYTDANLNTQKDRKSTRLNSSHVSI